MTDVRKPVFDAARAAGAQFDDADDVAILGAALTALGVPLAGAVAPVRPVLAPVPGSPIDMIDRPLLRIVCPQITDEWAGPIRHACIRFEINTIRRVAAFIAQMAHESIGFTALNENLSYSTPERIVAVFGQGNAGRRRFPTVASARPYVRNPEKLGNYVYANRMGNGPPSSGDGFKFRGGGPMHVTGRNNWTAFAAAMGMPLDEAMTYARTVEGGVMSAAWFWEVNDINRLADTPGVTDETKAINGGSNGLADRTQKFDKLVAEMLRRERTR